MRRHLRDLQTAEKRGYYFDANKASFAIELMEASCCYTKGEWAGKPFVLSPTQVFIAAMLFGWRKINDKTRRFRFAYLTMGRKWGKSEFAAAVGNLLTICDDPLEPAAEVYCAATKEEQAKIVHNVAKEMVRLSPILRSQAQVFAKSISVIGDDKMQPNSFFKPVGSDSKSSDGLNIHAAILDEIHEWRDYHVGLYDKLTTASGARRQPLILMITTAGDDFSIVWLRVDSFCCQVLDSYDLETPIGDTWFAFIARVDLKQDCVCKADPNCKICEGKGEIDADDALDPSVWRKSNPNYPITPKHDYLTELAADARHDPAAKNRFLRYHGNVRVSAKEKAISQELWSAAAGNLSDWSTAEFVSGAWDLGGRDDLAAIALCARFREGQDADGKVIYRYEFQQQAFINPSATRDLNKEPFRSFIQAGSLVVAQLELELLKQQAVDWWRTLLAKNWAYDPHTSRDVAQYLTNQGLDCTEFYQNAGMYNEPIRTFLAALKRGCIRHNGDALLSWAVNNLVVRANGKGEWMPDKAGSEDKVDPIVACLMAFRLATLAPQKESGNLFVF